MTEISIIIPTKNAGAGFRETLSALYRQCRVPSFEVMVIDSGSSDETLEICSQFPARVVRIPPDEFGHGRTRNLGASLAAGVFLVFLVQDALPVGTDWLKNLIEPLKSDDRIAAAYSRNRPRPDASRRQAQEIERYFQPEARLQSSPADHIFSNVSSAIKRSVFDRFPFPAVAFGEDQLWANMVLEAGFTIRYQPSSLVIHSHHDSLGQALHRGRQEGAFARSIGQGLWHASYLGILLELLFQTVKWATRGDLESCRYSVTMAAWHLGFRKGFGAKQ